MNCFLINEMFHYGIKGMKWGVRRTPEQLGHPTKISNKSVQSIVSSLSDEDLYKLNIGRNEKYNSKEVIHRVMKKVGNTPVSVFDIEYVNRYVMNATIITRNDKRYRGKGYATKAVKDGLSWWEKNKTRYGNIPLNWWVRQGNIGSIKLAVKGGFQLNEESSRDYPGWLHYQLK